ncbi:MAG: PspA/IM30 family protein, partial [Chloroflexi bacterium]|nr:PspA/IM30 family protein [Chloroflexota bacterium]
MGILERISTIMKANINDLLDRAENPEIMLEQYIRDLESGVNEAREELVNAMADEKRLAARLEERKRQVREWEEKAEQAVRLGKDEAARSALRAARAYQDEVQTTTTAWEAQKEKVAALQEQYEQIEKKLAT